MTVATTDPMRPHLYAIRRVRSETDDTFTMELAATNGTAPARFGAGQFNMVYVPGVGEIPISISGNPAQPTRLLHTTRAVGAVTTAMRALHRGDPLGIRGPFGVGWPMHEAAGKDVVLVAGGIGLAPLRPALYSLLAERERYGKIVLLYGTRTPADILFRRELETWRARLDIEVHVTVDRAMGHWHGNVGVVTSLIPKAPFDPLRAIAMVCGPEVMMRFTAIKLEERGVGPTSIYLSMERNMKCGIGLCGHCQYGPAFVCKDGPVFRYYRLKKLLATREV
ncbi:MAG: FAD/NAD(P)-binding protein [Actinobacteria bacterium]|nr:FAD/NAD(P)-binding protein [Actinomycetota bacterium]